MRYMYKFCRICIWIMKINNASHTGLSIRASSWKIPLENPWKWHFWDSNLNMFLDSSALKNLCLWCKFQSHGLLFIVLLLLKNFLTALQSLGLYIFIRDKWGQGLKTSTAHLYRSKLPFCVSSRNKQWPTYPRSSPCLLTVIKTEFETDAVL